MGKTGGFSQRRKGRKGAQRGVHYEWREWEAVGEVFRIQESGFRMGRLSVSC